MITTVENNRLYHPSADKLGTKGTLKIVFSYLHATEVAANSIVCKRFFYLACEHESVKAIKLLAEIRKATFQNVPFQRILNDSTGFRTLFQTKNYLAWSNFYGPICFSHRRINRDASDRHALSAPGIFLNVNSVQRLIAFAPAGYASNITFIDTKTRKIHSVLNISQQFGLPGITSIRGIFGGEELNQEIHIVLFTGHVIKYNPHTQNSELIHQHISFSTIYPAISQAMQVGEYLYLLSVKYMSCVISYINLKDINQKGILLSHKGDECIRFHDSFDDIFYVGYQNEVAGFKGSTKVRRLSYDVLHEKEKNVTETKVLKIIPTKYGVVIAYQLGFYKKRDELGYVIWNPSTSSPDKNGIACRFKLPTHCVFNIDDTIQNQDDLLFIFDNYRERVIVHHLPTRSTNLAIIPMKLWSKFKLNKNVDMNTEDVSFIKQYLKEDLYRQKHELVTYKKPRNLNIKSLEDAILKNALSAINKRSCSQIIKKTRLFKAVYFCYSLAKKAFCC